jgi:hypothetical protein
VVALLPMLIVFIIFQKQIIESIAISGVKGWYIDSKNANQNTGNILIKKLNNKK